MIMKFKCVQAVGLMALLMMSSSCAQAELAMDRAVFQRFEFGNDGHEAVHGVKIHYGRIVIPSGTANGDYEPSHMTAVSESQTVPVPESADVRWISGDGREHDVTIPIRSLVDNPSCFHGFRFFFVDDHIDIYMLSRKRDCSHIVEIERTKVYSSKSTP